MARQVISVLTDDLDGTEGKGIETVRFGLHGATYEIDLTRAHAKELEKALRPYLDKARKAGRPSSARRSVKSDAKTVRAWAVANGYDVPDRGRIPKTVQEAFQAAGN